MFKGEIIQNRILHPNSDDNTEFYHKMCYAGLLYDKWMKMFLEHGIKFEDVKISVNPMNGDILYKYKDNFLDIKSLQKQRIEDFLIEIDFNNVIDKLYDNNPKKYIRKVKLNKIK